MQEVQDYLKTISPNLSIVRGDFDEGNHPDEEASLAIPFHMSLLASLFWVPSEWPPENLSAAPIS